jgi:hypothetical protein
MSATSTSTATRAQSFRKQYKAQGIIAAVVLMWLDYGLTYHGLSANDPVVLGAGMVIMVAAVAIGFFFG